MVFVLAWLAVSVIAAAAFAFGASVGYRRGFEQARDSAREGDVLATVRPRDLALELRLPEGARHAP